MIVAEHKIKDYRPVLGGENVDLTLTFRTFGTLNASGTNVVLLPSYYTGNSSSYDRIIGPGQPLDPGKYFIICTDLFGNGRASSPSKAVSTEGRIAFPRLMIEDNVRCQNDLLTMLGVKGIRLVCGWSMGALQAYCWAAAYPDLVTAILPICGASRCWPQNFVFLEGVKAALVADPTYAAGAYEEPPVAGLRAFGRNYAGWAYSPTFYREALYRELGHASLDAFLRYWEDDHLGWDACDLLCMLDTWQTADIGRLHESGNWRDALAGIKAKVIVMPCDQDRYFTLEENRIEVGLIPNVELRPIVSAFGHSAGAPGRHPAESFQIAHTIRELLGTEER